jgi:hypothetical protein
MATTNLLYKSFINVRNITKGFFSLNEGLNKSNNYTARIGKGISEGSNIKRKSILSDSILFKRKVESVRRKKQEGIIELSKVGSIFKAPSRALTDVGESFISRILNYAGTIMAGWLIYNLPTITGMAQELTARVLKLTQILGKFLPNTGKVLFAFNDVLSAYAQNFSSFDFTDSQNRVENAMKNLQNSFSGMGVSFEEALKLITTPLTEPIEGPGAPPFGTDYSQRSALPNQNSPEMYRIAAALSTEGSGAQSTVDMMQVVVNRKATGRYGATYTDILSAGESVNRSQFQGVWKRPGGPKAFREIQSLEDASKWSGQSKDSLLKIIRDIQNPTLQKNASQFVGGALEFRASPQNHPSGRLPGTAWRGGPGDNQFLTDPSRGDPIRAEGPASFNLPAPIPPTSKTTPIPPVSNLPLIPQTGDGGFVQGGSGASGETTYATHFHIDLKNSNYTAEGLLRIREVAFQAVKAMQARGSTVYLTNYSQITPASKNDTVLRSQILRDQQLHGARSTPGIDIQEHNNKFKPTFPSQPGSKTKFPFAVGSVYWRGGYGREAEIIGSGGVTVSHGGPGSTASKVGPSPKPEPIQMQPVPRQPVQERIVGDQEAPSYVVPFIYPQQQSTQEISPSIFLQPHTFEIDNSLNSFIDKKILLDLAYT